MRYFPFSNLSGTEDKGWVEEKIEEFYNSLQEFKNAFSRMEQLNYDDAVTGILRVEYNELMESGVSLKDKIDSALNTIADIKAWLFGDDEEIGIAPVFVIVGLGAIALAMAAITKWVSDVYIFDRKIAETKRLAASGMSYENAANIINSQNSNAGLGLDNTLDKATNLVLLLGGGYLLYKMFIKK